MRPRRDTGSTSCSSSPSARVRSAPSIAPGTRRSIARSRSSLCPRARRAVRRSSEARNLARIRHPNIVTVYGAEQDSQHVGIWMEFIQGETLTKMVRDRGPMSAREVVGIGVDLCSALSALQGASLLHRDIKAHNVMREVGGRIVLMDFSGAWTSEAGETPANLSGTPLYMAPELFENRPPSVASDIYSLGVLLFYLLAGRLPVEGPSLDELKDAHARRAANAVARPASGTSGGGRPGRRTRRGSRRERALPDRWRVGARPGRHARGSCGTAVSDRSAGCHGPRGPSRPTAGWLGDVGVGSGCRAGGSCARAGRIVSPHGGRRSDAHPRSHRPAGEHAQLAASVARWAAGPLRDDLRRPGCVVGARARCRRGTAHPSYVGARDAVLVT